MKQRLLPVILLLAASLYLQADELVYMPVNPAFGGSALNGDWLLANAQAQNDYKDPDLKSREEKTALELFRETLQRLLLRDMASSISDYITDPDSTLPIGEDIDVGDFTVRIDELGDGTLEITAIDTTTGETTIFTVSSDF